MTLSWAISTYFRYNSMACASGSTGSFFSVGSCIRSSGAKLLAPERFEKVIVGRSILPAGGLLAGRDPRAGGVFVGVFPPPRYGRNAGNSGSGARFPYEVRQNGVNG